MNSEHTNNEKTEQPGLLKAISLYVDANRQMHQQSSACGWRYYIQNLYLSLDDK